MLMSQMHTCLTLMLSVKDYKLYLPHLPEFYPDILTQILFTQAPQSVIVNSD